MTNDSNLFRTAEELEAAGAYPVQGGRFEQGAAQWLPLMAGRSIHLFDHRYASVLEVGAEDVPDEAEAAVEIGYQPTTSRNVKRSFSSGVTTPTEHANVDYLPKPRHWVSESETSGRWPNGIDWSVAIRHITSASNSRTIIAAITPTAAFSNAIPLLLPSDIPAYKLLAPLFLSNLCSLAFDYVARTKVQSVNLNFYIVEQLPFIAPADFTRPFGPRTAADIVRDDVLHLTYTAHDLAPFARDQGYDGQPFLWDEEDRLRRRARLDAVFMLLYGLDRPTAGYILDTFPIVRREETERHGRFRSKDLVLRTMAALEAGNPDARIDG